MTKRNPDVFTVVIMSNTLTDGSQTFDVIAGNSMRISAYSEQDAHDLAYKIRDAVEQHSVATTSIEC